MATKTHKGQHFVPESYLKAWCDPACPPQYNPYVWIFDRNGNDPRRRTPSNIFKESDLYTIEKADGTRDLRLEHGLSGLESRFARIRSDRLDQQLPLDDEERTTWHCSSPLRNSALVRHGIIMPVNGKAY